MRIYLALALAAVVLVACNPGVDPGTTPDTTLSSMDVRSAYFLAAGSGSRAVASGSLYYVEDGQTGEVTWYDAAGAAVTVTVSEAKALSSGRMVLSLTYNGETGAYIAQADGSLVGLAPMPTGWTYARESGDSLYYVASDGLYKASLTTGVSTRLSFDGDTVPSGAWIIVGPSGAVVLVYAGQQYVYLPDGSRAQVQVTSLPSPATETAVEGYDGAIYSIRLEGGALYTYAFTETSPGAWLGPDSGVGTLLVTLPWTPATAEPGRISSSSDTRAVTLGYDTGVVRVEATATGLQYSVTSNPSAWSGLTYLGSGGSYTSAEDRAVYHAFHEIAATGDGYDVTRYHLWALQGGTMTPRDLDATGSVEIGVDYRVEKIVAAAGALFYERTTDTGAIQTMIYDGSEIRLYAEGAVAIQPIQ